jgi:hypothetical protein
MFKEMYVLSPTDGGRFLKVTTSFKIAVFLSNISISSFYEFARAPLLDGRVIYERWEYVDHS